jgi:AcrR family transcriptional regulator
LSSKLTEKLLSAAVESFAADGFHGSTTKLISDRAGCTEGSLFRLFGSKEKLFGAAVLRAFQTGQMPNEELARILDNDDNFERALRRGILEFFDRLGENYVRITMFSCLERPELVRAHLMDSSFAKVVAHTIEREIYRGNLRDDIDPHTAALALTMSLWQFAFVSPIMATELKAKSREARRGAVKNFVEIWFHGMRKNPSKTPRKQD